MMPRFTKSAYLVVLLAAVLAGSVTAKGAAAAASCAPGEVIHMIDPVVTVIDGPGDPEMEQQRWADLASAYLEGQPEGPQSVSLGNTTFDLEAVP